MLSFSPKPGLRRAAAASATEIGAAALPLGYHMSLQANVCEASVGGVVGWSGDFGMGPKEPPLLESQIHPGKGFADDSVAVDVFHVSGSVRWFDPSKGYGFLVPDQDLPNVLLH